MKGNFKVRGLKNWGKDIVKGKVYEYINGRCEFDAGWTSGTYDSFEDLMKHNPGTYGRILEEFTGNQSIVIYPKGREVIATIKEGKKVVKTAKATCNPSDTFNFEYGAKLAFRRLMGEETILVSEPKKVSVSFDSKKLSDGRRRLTEALVNFGKAEFDWDGFKQYKFAVRCNTREEAREFLRECDLHDIKWVDGNKASSRTNWFNSSPQILYFGQDSELTYSINPELHKDDTIIDYSPSTVKKVKRPAKVGEWIEIVSPVDGKYYSEGDICEVAEVNIIGGVFVKTEKTHPCNRGVGTSYLYEKEYVVLENYKEATR